MKRANKKREKKKKKNVLPVFSSHFLVSFSILRCVLFLSRFLCFSSLFLLSCLLSACMCVCVCVRAGIFLLALFHSLSFREGAKKHSMACIHCDLTLRAHCYFSFSFGLCSCQSSNTFKNFLNIICVFSKYLILCAYSTKLPFKKKMLLKEKMNTQEDYI